MDGYQFTNSPCGCGCYHMIRFGRRLFTSNIGKWNEKGLTMSSPPTPKELVRHFDRHVIGQDKAKQVVSVAIYNHFCRLFQRLLTANEGPLIEKSNIMLVGPSGTGKTLLAKTAADILNVPFAMADATSFTEAGYVGEDVDLMLFRLFEASGFNLAIAQRGIVFLDEVDKLAKSAPNVLHGGKDVGGQGVQQALLKMIEGSSVDVKDRRKGVGGGDKTTLPFDTSSLLFIFSGAFNGIDEIVKERLSRKAIGFIGKGESQIAHSNFMSIDFINFGLIPEFIGRIPVVAKLEQLDQRALERILTEPVGSLTSQYKSLFAFNHVSLEFTDEAISAIAELALKLNVGARGLRSILEGVLQDWMFEVPNSSIQRIRIDADVIVSGAKPAVEYRQKQVKR